MRVLNVRRVIVLCLVVCLALVVGLSAGCKDKNNGGQTPPVAGSEDASDTPTPPVPGSQQTTTPATPGPGGGTNTLPAAPPTDPAATTTVWVYWVEAGEAAFATQRTIPYTTAVGRAAMDQLLAGPTSQELKTWPALSTAIPAGTKLLGLTISNGVAKVDLSKEFESGGGTFSVTARLAQVVYTLDQFSTVNAVEFYIEGVKVKMFSSEGLILDGPQTFDDYEHLLPVDA